MARTAQTVRILGLDPALATCGHGVIEWRADAQSVVHVAHGCFGTDASDPMPARVDAIVRHLDALIRTHRPDAISAEAFVWYGAGAGAGTHVMRVCGAIRALGIARGIPVFEYQARALKLAVTGSANGDKLAMQKAVQAALSLPELPTPNHAADALGAALTHLAFLRSHTVVVSEGVDTFGNVARITTPAKRRAPVKCSEDQRAARKGKHAA